MTTASSFGPRLSRQDYERRCRALWDYDQQALSDEEREAAELHLLIDYKLGVNFPVEQRQAVFRARRNTRRKILLNIVIGFLMPGRDPTSQVLLQMVKELAKSLPRDQVAQFTDQSMEDLNRILGPASSRSSAPR